MTIALRVNAENLYEKILKKGLKLSLRDDFNYKEYLITMKIYKNNENTVIEIIATHETFSDLCFENKYIYFTKDEVIEMVKKDIDKMLNENFYNGK